MGMCFSAIITILYLLPLEQRYIFGFLFLPSLPQIIFPLTKLCCGQTVPSRPPQNISLSECILLSVFSILINLFLDKSCEGEDSSFLLSHSRDLSSFSSPPDYMLIRGVGPSCLQTPTAVFGVASNPSTCHLSTALQVCYLL